MASVNLSAVIGEAIRLQRGRIKAFERDPERSERDYNDALKVQAYLVNQARSLAKDGVRAIDKLSPEEKRDVIVAYAESLPRNQQQQLMSELLRVINDERKVG